MKYKEVEMWTYLFDKLPDEAWFINKRIISIFVSS